jgi:predicted dehydrogenase
MKPVEPFVGALSAEPAALLSRKQFLTRTGLGLAAVGLVSTQACEQGSPRLVAQSSGGGVRPESPPAKNTDPSKPTDPIKLEEWKAKTEREDGPVPSPTPPDQRVGIALVGLGHLSLEQLLPAFGECKKAKVVALVSGDADKARKVARQYGISEKALYNYQNYDSLRDNPAVQAVYIVLPNALHEEFTVRAAKAGKHVLCEKPMAASSAQAQRMIDACRAANRKLMIAYRIQYEPYNRVVRDLVRSKQFGPIKLIEASNGQNSANPDHWRHKRALAGGGALPDVGIYCLNTIRYLLGEEPTEVFAYQHSTPNDPRFREVEEQVTWQMRFPSGVVANCASGYGYHEHRQYRVLAERGWAMMQPAFAYQGLELKRSRAEGMMELTEDVKLAEKNQFALEIDHFAECVREDKTPFTPGEEGLQDHRIMEAIYQSAREGKPVKLPAVDGLDAFRGSEPRQEG